MIQSELSRSGHGILKRDGRLLASSFDPLREAAAWAHQASQTIGFGQADSLIVLGLGCGYHVAALSAHAKSIIVLEASVEVAKITLENLSFEENVKVIVETTARHLLTHRELARTLKTQFIVLPHQASVSCDQDFYDHALKTFLSRDMESFLLHLRERPELYAALDKDVLQKLAASNDPVTIQTLRKLFRREGPLSQERRIWKALEELIA